MVEAMDNIDRRLTNLAISIVWTLNIALSGINQFSFEQSWTWGILGGLLIFAVLSLVEDEGWHDLLVIILLPVGVIVLILLILIAIIISI